MSFLTPKKRALKKTPALVLFSFVVPLHSSVLFSAPLARNVTPCLQKRTKKLRILIKSSRNTQTLHPPQTKKILRILRRLQIAAVILLTIQTAATAAAQILLQKSLQELLPRLLQKPQISQ